MNIPILIVLFFLGIVVLPAYSQPVLKDNGFVVQKYVKGICCNPTTMAFEGPDILVLEKVSGQVMLVKNGVLQATPVLHENVTSIGEQGMLGITTSGSKVFLYFTESTSQGGPPLGKRVYSYDWNGTRLVHKTLVRDLPQTQTYHNGGAMVTDRNGSVFLIVGDAGRFGKLQNKVTGKPDDTSVILRISPPGPYYAVGIRNSFGLAIDPVTGNMWDTENGPDFGDEVNLVPPGFNSGWDSIMGPANKTQLANLPGYPGYTYHDPQFTWEQTIAPTGISFENSESFEKSKNSLFVGDCNNGNLYRFELNQKRDSFVFKSPQLEDKVVNTGDSMDEIIFGTGFGCISDVLFGPDGLLYVVSLSDGTIYRIIPKNQVFQSGSYDSFLGENWIYFTSVGIIAPSIIYLKLRSRKKGNIQKIAK